MSITQKLQELDAELDLKILDPQYELSNAASLLQLKAYIKTLLQSNSGGNSGGGGVDTTPILGQILTALNSNNSNNNTDFAELSTLLTQANNINSTSNVQLASVNTDLTSIIANQITIITRLNTLISRQPTPITCTSSTATINNNNVVQSIITADSNRKYLVIQNNSDSNDIWIGFQNNITNNTGLYLPRASVIEINTQNLYLGEVWAYKTSGNGRLSIITGIAA